WSMVIGRAYVCGADDWHPDAVGPGVIAGETRVFFPVSRTEEKTVVGLRAAGIERIHAPEDGSGSLWIRQLEQPSLVHIRELAAGTGRSEPVLSGGTIATNV